MPTAVQASEIVAARWRTTARAHGHRPEFVDELGASIRYLGEPMTTRLGCRPQLRPPTEGPDRRGRSLAGVTGRQL